MEPTYQKKLLETIGNIFDTSKDSKLKPELFEKMDPELTGLSEYFNVSKTQCLFIANIFVLNYQSGSSDISDLSDYFGCNPIEILKYLDEIESLVSKGILKKSKPSHGPFSQNSKDQYRVNEKVTQAVLKNEPLPTGEQIGFNDIIDLLERIYNLSQEREEGELSTGLLRSRTNEIIHSNMHFPLIKRLYDIGLNITDFYVCLYIIWYTISKDKCVDIKKMCDEIFERSTDRVKYAQKIISEENELMKQHLISIVENAFFDDSEIYLSDKSIDILNECGIKVPVKKKRMNNLIIPETIPYRKLIFNDKENEQLNLFKELLKDSNFKDTQNRLASKNLPKGITALFHGFPGTGKTETVLQAAKENNRQIMKVEISQSKSLWFGESEKIIKRIFTDYSDFAKDCEQAPILLFNEADAIFSKRTDNSTSSISQTENAMQNILLEELENFNGILIATTNMITRLDKAFDRRFLFKIRFDKPDIQAKTKIWKLKLPELKKSECEQLAKSYEFSGGQIDNIVRKYQIEEIIHGNTVSIDKIIEFCESETSDKQKQTIGFNKH